MGLAHFSRLYELTFVFFFSLFNLALVNFNGFVHLKRTDALVPNGISFVGIISYLVKKRQLNEQGNQFSF